jgi:hypothetical protein
METWKYLIKKFEENFMKIDKLIMMVLANLFTVFFFSLTKSMFWGVIITFALVLLKEIVYDKIIRKGEINPVDISAGSIGVFIGWISTILVLAF